MPIETFTKAGRKRLRWTFNRIISGQRVRQTKILPAGISTAEADSLARSWEAEIYALATGQRKEVVTIGECVKLHVADKCAEWKDASARIGILEKWAPEYKDQDATDLHEWSKQLVGYMRAKKRTMESRSDHSRIVRSEMYWRICGRQSSTPSRSGKSPRIKLLEWQCLLSAMNATIILTGGKC